MAHETQSNIIAENEGSFVRAHLLTIYIVE